MKRHFSILMALVMLFSCLCGTSAFAAESATSAEATVSPQSADSEIRPIGSLSGYGSHWYNSGEPVTGSFTVEVTGSWWIDAQLTVNIDSFTDNTAVTIIVYRPDGTQAWSSMENGNNYGYAGDITMANRDDWHNIKFGDGEVGTYTVEYYIQNTDDLLFSYPSSGRINCWIY